MVFSVWRDPSSLLRLDFGRAALLLLAAIAVGAIGWSGEARLLPVAMLFPALWSMSRSRMTAAMVSAGYFLAASRGLPQGVSNFYETDMGAGLMLWFAASAGFVLVHATLWTARPGRRRALRYCGAAILMTVPPFGIVGWAHPITAAGVLFPGWGWFGLVAAAIALVLMTTGQRPVAALVLGGLWFWSAATWTDPRDQPGWVGIDTRFRGENGRYAGYDQQIETIQLVRDAASKGAEVVVLPEGSAGVWTPTTERLWVDALQGMNVVVNAGAITINGDSYDNVMVEVSAGGSRIVYRERMPVPVSMWQPWLAWFGESGGATAHFFDNPAVDLAGKRIAPLICYEQLLVWPILQSALHGPDMMVATDNGWWTEGTNIVAIQYAAMIAWARLFDLPTMFAFNT